MIARLHYPRSGWLSLALVAVLALTVAWSVQKAEWLPQLHFLPPVAAVGVAMGALLGLLPVRLAIVLPLSAIAGGLMLVWAIGGEYFPDFTLMERVYELRDEVRAWTSTVLATGYPAELSPYAVALGALLWALAFIASYSVYRHNRALDAIVLLGAAMITNMSATVTDLIPHLILFVSAALLLWLRSTLAGRQEGWQQRRVNENLEVRGAIMRSGVAFAAASIALAWGLTTVAVAAPLTEAWRGFDGLWTSVQDGVDGVFGSLTNPQSRITGNSFGSSFTVTGTWVSNDEETLRVAASRALYMRTGTYDRYTGRGWERSDGTERQVPAGEYLFSDLTPERPTVAAAVEVETITVEMRQTIGRNLFTAGSPLRVFAPAVIQETAGQPVLGAISSPTGLAPGEAYQLQVAISVATKSELRSAGTDYPEAVRALYLDDSAVTDRVRALAEEITAGATNPYDKAELLADFLSSDPRFTYATTAPVAPPGVDMVEFFLFDEDEGRVGYCQYYASAMAMMSRALGLPARVAVGFAPGERVEEGIFLNREANAHAWVEIYFPGYGWQIFEATKTIDPGFIRPAGEPRAGGPPSLVGVDPLLQIDTDPTNLGPMSLLPSFQPVPGAVDPAGGDLAQEADGRAGNALLIALILGAAVTVMVVRMRDRNRRWRLLSPGERAWQQLTLAAQRAGVGPQPSETIYEYSGWLEDQLPRHVEPIRTVADGKVWQAYSGRRLSVSAARRLEAAIERLRRPLLWLAIRRRLRTLFRRT